MSGDLGEHSTIEVMLTMSRRVWTASRLSTGCLAVTVLALALVACGASPASTPQTSSPSPVTSPAGSPPAASRDVCRPTRPNGSTPPGEQPSRLYHGNGRIWTALWPRGVIVFRPGGPGEIRPDGSLVMKTPFWRGPGVAGDLVVTGVSLDHPGMSMTGEATGGYGDAGFQASALIFPGPGCWRVTATVGHYSLTFVAEVVRQP